jgi:hypothetical protein
VIARPDLALQSITLIETNKTAMGDYNLSFRVNVKNVGNVDVAGASIDCVPYVYVAPTQRKLNVGSANKRVSPYTHVSGAGESHVVPFDLRISAPHMGIWAKNEPGQITCKLKFDIAASDTVAGNNEFTAPWDHPERGALIFPLYSR